MDPKFPFNPLFPQFPWLWMGPLGFPFSLGEEGKTDTVCSLGNDEALDVVCMEERFLAMTVDYPEAASNQGVAHCGRTGSSLAERIFVTGKGEELLRLYREKNSEDIFFKPDCSIPVLWDLTHHFSDHGLLAGTVSFLQMKGKSLWVPMNLCTDVGYLNFTIRRPRDLRELEEYLKDLIVEPSHNVYACHTPRVLKQLEGNQDKPSFQPMIEAIRQGVDDFQSALALTSGVLVAELMRGGFGYSAAMWLGGHVGTPHPTPEDIQQSIVEEGYWEEEGDETEWEAESEGE